MNIYLNAGGGTNNYDLSAFTHSFRTDLTPALGDTTFTLSDQTNATIQVSFGPVMANITGTISRVGDSIRGEFNGGVAGSFTLNRAQRIEYRSGSGTNQVSAGNLEGADIEQFLFLGSSNDDTFGLVMSPTITYTVHGGANMTGNSLTVDRNGFDAMDDGEGQVSATGAMSVFYTDIQNLTIIGATPTPTPTPTPSVEALTILLSAQTAPPSSDANTDGITDSADVHHQTALRR
jgi:hypothetical protein